jgi:photosystem II stability/assembly factor-like uncharacterized protein
MLEKNKKYLVLYFIVLIFSMGCRTAPQENWHMILQTEIVFKNISAGMPGVNAAGFLNESYCIAGCHRGIIYYTMDGGNNWIKANNPPSDGSISNLEILNENLAWCLGVGCFRRTTDGAKNWIELPYHAWYYMENLPLSFINESIGWYAKRNKLFETMDGGIHWTEVSLQIEDIQNIIAIDLLSEDTGYILLNTGILCQTKDGGRTWDNVQLPLNGKELIKTLAYNYEDPVYLNQVGAVRFLNTMHGIVILYAVKPEKGYFILETSDGGKTWKEEKLPDIGTIPSGSVFLSPDGKYLTINDINLNKIFLFMHE